MSEARPFYSAGRWTVGSGRPLPVSNPATGEVIAEFATASKNDLDEAVSAARQALQNSTWKGLKSHLRARILHRMAALIDADADRLAKIQLSDNGKTLSECRSMIESAANTFRYYAAVCETHEDAQSPSRGNYRSQYAFEAVGLVAAITPWNSPATLEAQKIAPILAAGNALILKPSEFTPQIALEYARIGYEAGLPSGVFSVLTGDGSLGKEMVIHPDVDMVSFTGGTVAGRHIASEAGKLLRPVILELGGKSPNIVLEDADLDLAVAGVAGGIFSGAGESCVAGSRIFVHQDVIEDFTRRLVAKAQSMVMGDPADPSVSIGPLIHAAHRTHVHGFVERALSSGATLLTGGVIPADNGTGGAYYPPTLLTGVSNRDEICQQEIFGPVGVILSFNNDADLLAQANDIGFGLASGIWTQNLSRALRLADDLQAGTVWINTYKQLSISTPFEGHKASGLGREKGLQGMTAYMKTKAVFWATETN